MKRIKSRLRYGDMDVIVIVIVVKVESKQATNQTINYSLFHFLSISKDEKKELGREKLSERERENVNIVRVVGGLGWKAEVLVKRSDYIVLIQSL